MHVHEQPVLLSDLLVAHFDLFVDYVSGDPDSCKRG